MTTIPTSDGRVALTAELARAPYRKFGASTLDEFLVELRGLQGVKAYNEMRRSDPSVGTALRAIKEIIGQTRWQSVPGGDAQADEDAAAFLWTCVEDMSETWADFVTDALTCLDFGWAYIEAVFKLRRGPDADPSSLHDDGRIGWRKFTLVPHDTLDPAKGWQYDEQGGIEGLWQQVMAVDGTHTTFIPIEKALLFRMDRERNNPEGVSMLRTAYRPWHFKKNLEDIEAIGAERDATGTLVISLPVGATTADRNAARDILERYKADDMLGFIRPRNGPNEYEAFGFELLGSPGARQYNTNDIIKRYSYEIIRSFLAQFLMLGESNRGSNALSRDHRDLFHMSLRAILQNLAATINRFAVRPLFRYNRFEGLTALPTLQPGRILPGALDSFANAMKTLVETGLIVADKPVRALVREVAELPPEAEEEEAKPEEMKPAEGEREAAEFDEDYDDEDAWERAGERVERYTEVDWDSDEPGDDEVKAFAATTPLAILRMQIAGSQGVMAHHADRLVKGNITPTEFGRCMWRETQDVYAVSAKLAIGRAKPADAAAIREQMRDVLREQRKYINGFVADLRKQIAEGKPLGGRVAQRAELYAKGARGFYNEMVLEASGAEYAIWNLSAAQHCETCLEMAAGNPWRRADLKRVPGDGSTKCVTSCKCWLSYRRQV